MQKLDNYFHEKALTVYRYIQKLVKSTVRREGFLHVTDSRTYVCDL